MSSALCGLRGGGEPPEGLKIVDSPIYALGLQSFASALTFVVSQFAPAPLNNKWQRYVDLTGLHFRRSHTNAEAHALLRRALTVFEDWPKNYYSFLDERRAEIDTAASRRAASKSFSRLQSALFVRLPSQDFAFVRSAFRKYQRIRRFEVYVAACGGASKTAEENIKNTARPLNVGDITAQRHSSEAGIEIFEAHVSISKACKELRIGRAGVERLIAAGTLKAMAGINGKGRVYFVEKESLETLKSKLEQSLGLRQAGHLLGVRKSRVTEMAECGLLNPLRGPVADGSPDWRFDRTEVVSLLDRLAGGVPKKRKVDGRKYVAFTSALMSVSSSGVSLGAFLLAVLGGELKPVGKTGGIGLRGLLFSEKQVAAFARSEFRLLAGDVMTISEVAKALGVGEGAVNFLVGKGFLHAEKIAGLPLAGKLVSRDEFDAFNETYLSASKIASEHKTGSKHLIKSLAARVVHPVSGPKIDDGYIYLYRAGDVAPLDVAAVIAEGRTTRLIVSKSPRRLADLKGWARRRGPKRSDATTDRPRSLTKRKPPKFLA